MNDGFFKALFFLVEKHIHKYSENHKVGGVFVAAFCSIFTPILGKMIQSVETTT